jgi:hypothetical protein
MKTAIALVFACLILSSVAASSESQIVASHDARFLVNGTWGPADKLKPGDVFVTPDGKRAIVRDLESVSIDNESCYGLITDSQRGGFLKEHNSAPAHGSRFTRWWRWARALFG